MDGLLEGSPEVDGALLDHLSDVLDPVLLVLDARRLLPEFNESAYGRRPTFGNLISHKSEFTLQFGFSVCFLASISHFGPWKFRNDPYSTSQLCVWPPFTYCFDKYIN